MGISHPLSDECYGGGGGMLLMSPERSPPSSPPPPTSCCSAVDGQDDFLEHEVSRMDTLAGIAIKYGVEKGTIFVWTADTETAFQTLKTALITAPVLALPDFTEAFVIDTDACDVGIGAVLSQKGHPVAFVSRSLGPRNRCLSIYEKENLAILLAVQHWRPYLQVGEFTIRTDHKSLSHLTDQRLHTEWQQKTLTKLMGLQYKIIYKKGVLNGAADALSRKPAESSEMMSITAVQPIWLQSVQGSYVNDVSAQKLLHNLARDPSSEEHYSLDQGILRFKGRIWVGADTATQLKIVSAFHDSPQGGHSGFPATY